jgi:hypothetical protein
MRSAQGKSKPEYEDKFTDVPYAKMISNKISVQRVHIKIQNPAQSTP